MRRCRRGALAVPALLVGVLTLSGCASTEAQDDEIRSTDKDVARWALPLDSYRPPTGVNYEYARNLLVRDCMAEQGLDFEVVPVDIYADGPVTANRYGRRLFTPELAATYGYHPAATDRFDRAEAQRIFEHRYSTEEADAIDACRQGSLEELPRLAASLTDALSFSINAGADQRVQQAASRWRN